MRIVVNTRLLLKNKLEGIGWFEYETLKRIANQHKDVEFIFVFDRQYDSSFIFSDNITPVIAHPQARHPFLYCIWFEYSIPKILKHYNPDLFLSPDGYISLRSDSKTLAVFHDLNFEHFPQHLPFITCTYYRYFFHRFASHATRLATVSEFSKNDIIKTYNISPDKIDVVYNGSNEIYKPSDEETKSITLKKYTNGLNYFLFIGSIHPRKNLTGLFNAYDKFRSNHDKYKLLIVGEKRWWTNDIENAFDHMQFKDDVVFTGMVQTTELNNIIGAATALVYPSFFEGFGIPILEAFSCGVPVITSNVTSMPEIAGDAALMIDPSSIDSICNAMQQIISDDKLRTELIEKGNIRKQSFSWQKTADNLWASIQKTLSS